LHNIIDMIVCLSTIPFSDKIINLMVDIWGGQGDKRGHHLRPPPPPLPPPPTPPPTPPPPSLPIPSPPPLILPPLTPPTSPLPHSTSPPQPPPLATLPTTAATASTTANATATATAIATAITIATATDLATMPCHCHCHCHHNHHCHCYPPSDFCVFLGRFPLFSPQRKYIHSSPPSSNSTKPSAPSVAHDVASRCIAPTTTAADTAGRLDMSGGGGECEISLSPDVRLPRTMDRS
jgi:hypothetical protein